MTERTLNMKIRQLEKLEAEKQLLEKQIEAIKTSIQSTMGDSEELSTKTYIIRWTKIVANRLDGKSLKADLPDLYSKYCKPAISRRFSFTTIIKA
jgi:Phage-related protein, predicted endonuclease